MNNYKVEHFKTKLGADIFQLPLEAFPNFWAFAYLVYFDGDWVLIDTGSGFGKNNQDLEEGFKSVGDSIGKEIDFEKILRIFITHGHIDHFGGLNFIKERCSAKVGVHILDQRSLTNIDERLNLVALRLMRFFLDAGVPTDETEQLLQLYKMSKLDFRSIPVDFTIELDNMELGAFEFLHVPGHCAGQVVIRLHDVVFCGDHILSDITPHQAPERITMNTGLTHYLNSLNTFESWLDGTNLALPGHQNPIRDISKRIGEIRDFHMRRLSQVLDIAKQPKTIQEISSTLFGDTKGYNEILALEESGAHVEYLYQRSLLRIENWGTLSEKNKPLPLLYKRV
ncbi:MAG TPA: MBL fold metallo-hydrolase [Anaerolineae bacterium]|nr:MBL fold metallo-hydrolase [Anaerolineae bacterium]